MAIETSGRSAEHVRLLEAAEGALVGGVPGLFRLPDEIQLVVREGRGSKLYDVDGREYIDYLLGSGPLILGHAHPAIVEAVSRQAKLGSHYFLPSEPTIQLAQKIRDAVPCADLVRFVGSGSEAVTAALRMARAFTGRDKVLKFEGGYHGTSDYALYDQKPHGSAPESTAHVESAGIPKVLAGEMLVAPFNDLETTTRLIAEHAGELAAVVLEPLQRCVVPTDGFLDGVLRVAREHRVVTVFDEVVTGFRLAWGGGQEYYSALCDLAAYGKALSGGYALAAVAGRREIMALSDPRIAGRDEYAVLGGTMSGNPLSTAAALATLGELEKPGVYERLHAIGNRLRDGLVAVGEIVGLPLQAPGEGPCFQPLISEHPVTDARAISRGDLAATYRFGVELVRGGVLLSVGTKMYVSTEHTDEDIDRTLEIAERALRRVRG
ncbi:MAG TPA: aspartate aminotransferase family protein [Chloroflexota bacterium]|nr:aspartate aminotransferase family protein [Chloroflexota bacterium]